jgi:hypothetical protein
MIIGIVLAVILILVLILVLIVKGIRAILRKCGVIKKKIKK